MRIVRRLFTGSLAAAAVLTPALTARAQTEPAGIVTTVQGTANVTRVSATPGSPQLLPLNFKDKVYLQDFITTADQSLARILLGGKAVVTVREHSSLRITSTPSSETIDITSGKIAIAVAKERLKPGERIDVRTPNAVAGVRGTMLIAEVTAAVGGAPVSSLFVLLSGLLNVTATDGGGNALGAPFDLKPLQMLGVVGFTLPSGVSTITLTRAQAYANAYRPALKDPSTGSSQPIADRHVEQVGNTTGGVGGGGGVDTLKPFAAATATSTGTVVSGTDRLTRGGAVAPERAEAPKPAPPLVVVPPPPPPVCQDCFIESARLAPSLRR